MDDATYSQLDMLGPFLRSPYNYDRNQASLASGLECTDPSRTDQAQADDCDIYKMLGRYFKGDPEALRLNGLEALQGDFSEVGDYRSMLDQLQAAQDTFKALPAEVRKFFDNDPGAFMDYTADPANLEKLRELGLANAESPKIYGFKDVVEALDKLKPQES